MRNNIVSIRILEHIKNTGCSLTTEIFNFNRTKEFISINAAYLSGIMVKNTSTPPRTLYTGESVTLIFATSLSEDNYRMTVEKKIPFRSPHTYQEVYR